MSEAEEFLKEKINIPESDSPVWVPFIECVDYMETYSEETLKALTKDVEEQLETSKKDRQATTNKYARRELAGEVHAYTHVLNLINNHLDDE